MDSYVQAQSLFEISYTARRSNPAHYWLYLHRGAAHWSTNAPRSLLQRKHVAYIKPAKYALNLLGRAFSTIYNSLLRLRSGKFNGRPSKSHQKNCIFPRTQTFMWACYYRNRERLSKHYRNATRYITHLQRMTDQSQRDCLLIRFSPYRGREWCGYYWVAAGSQLRISRPETRLTWDFIKLRQPL